ncbi:MAG TPA: PEP-CTERM sorting domain-containing protein [Fimbriimonadaceae bacterium]|nr:PEP-CTERM sorting domain-containing protein [Fimbriimonadaceae bacterium]
MRILLGLTALALSIPANAQVFNVLEGGSVGPLFAAQFFFEVSGVTGPIADIDVRLAMSCEDVTGVSFDLFAPNGLAGLNWNAPLGTGAHFQDTYLDDEVAGSRLGQPGSDIAPFAGPEWGGRRYRPPTDLNVFDGTNPNGVWLLIAYNFSSITTEAWLHKSGEAAPWGQAIGTQLIITPVPEPSCLLALGSGLLCALLKRQRR